jgi:hypothetical protein
VIEYRTIDGGHPAPYPDMTDEQLYNYEVAFNLPKKTFDKPPAAARHKKAEPIGREERRQQAGAGVHAAARPAAGAAWNRPAERRMSSYADPADPVDTEAPDTEVRTVTASDAGKMADAAPNVALHAAGEADASAALDFSRPVRTVTTKQPVEIITTRARHPVYKVHGYIGQDEVVTVFTLDGRLSENGPLFLENAPSHHQLFLNFYPNRDANSRDKYIVTQHGSRAEADAAATPGRITCLPVRLDMPV